MNQPPAPCGVDPRKAPLKLLVKHGNRAGTLSGTLSGTAALQAKPHARAGCTAILEHGLEQAYTLRKVAKIAKCVCSWSHPKLEHRPPHGRVTDENPSPQARVFNA